MTSQLLTRIDTDLKNRFKARAQEQGLSMDFLINTFIKSYTEKPESVQVYIDDDMLDAILVRSMSTPQAKSAFTSLHKTLQSKGL